MRFNPLTPVGIVLIVLGIVAFAYQGDHLHQSREGYRYWPDPCHRRHSENHSALASCGERRFRGSRGAGRNEEIVVRPARNRGRPRKSYGGSW